MFIKITLNKVKNLTDNHILAVNNFPTLLDVDYYGYTSGKNGINSVVYVFYRDEKKLALSVGNKPIGKKDDRYTSLVNRYNHIKECAMRDKRYHVDIVWKGKLLAYLRKRFIRQLFHLEFGC